MQAKTILPVLHATMWIAIWSTAMIGLTATAFAQNQPVATDSLVKVVESGDLTALRTRLSSGADPNTPEDSEFFKGWTPLMAAAYSGNVDAARLLLGFGAKVNARNQFGATALDIALRAGKTQVAAFLRSRGARATGASASPPSSPPSSSASLCSAGGGVWAEEGTTLQETTQRSRKKSDGTTVLAVTTIQKTCLHGLWKESSKTTKEKPLQSDK